MAENNKPKTQLEELRTLTESVNFGDLKNELANNSNAVSKTEQPQRDLHPKDIADLKNEVRKADG